MTEQPVEERWPMPGDAVRLLGPYGEAETGARGVIGGPLGAILAEGYLNLAPRVFRDDVSVEAGEGTLVPFDELVLWPHGTVTVSAWRWVGAFPGHGGGEEFEYEVPLWQWFPGLKAPGAASRKIQ